MTRPLLAALGATAVACVLLPWFAGQDHTAVLAAYLAVWWCCIGTVMGGLANVWMHNLTGGAWGEAIRKPLLGLSGTVWILAPLFLPVLLGLSELYAWAARAPGGASGWAAGLPASLAGFKIAWLNPLFFTGRSVACLAVWVALAWLSGLPCFERSRRFSVLALTAYGVTVSLAAVDWIMSLMPLWYSSVFGLLAGIGQMLAGMAAAILLISLRRVASTTSANVGDAVDVSEPASGPPLLRDLGNLLLMYVLMWAYLEFTQFLIIWAANLPREIAWYLPRMQPGWAALAIALALAHFALPLLALLFRGFKQSAPCMATLAAGLLLLRVAYTWWSIFPSLQLPPHWVPRALVETLGLAGLAAILAVATSRRYNGVRHA